MHGTPSRRLSDADGQPHILLAGRPIGLEPELISGLERNDIHLHVYGELKGRWADWLATAQRAAPRHLHQHPLVEQDRWLSEFSQYDAGWLHYLPSKNGGDLRRATWDDLNYPARMATLMVAGLPLLQYDNAGAIVATDALARELDIGLFFRDVDDLAAQLRDRARLEQVRANVWRSRPLFTFDAHADELVAFFRQVIAGRRGSSPGSATS